MKVNLLRTLFATHRFCRPWGIDVQIMYIFYPFIAAILWIHFSGVTDAHFFLAVIGLAMLPFFVLIHELGHAKVALREGVNVLGILIHPLGGRAVFRGRVPGPLAELRIALAGPFANFGAALASYPLLYRLGYANPSTGIFAEDTLVQILSLSCLGNAMLGLFNLLPVFPLDGGRVATALAVIFLGSNRGLSAMRIISFSGVLGLAGCGVILLQAEFHGHFRLGAGLILLATFLHTSGRQEIEARLSAARFMIVPVVTDKISEDIFP